jgi:tRNA (mo5U34)-methyltransferase
MTDRPLLDRAALRDAVLSRPWFHTIDLGDGLISPGVDRSGERLGYFHLPESFAGKTVLDIGAYDGFFSFEAERRGASRVVACDDFCWSYPAGTMADGEGFLLAHQALNSKVERRQIRVEDIGPDTVGTFDYVLFLGVLYHSQDPLRYLRHVYSVCKETLILETRIDAVEVDRPAMIFYPGATLNNDPSNYWGPNPACVTAMLVEVGFREVEVVDEYYGDRMVFHAHR